MSTKCAPMLSHICKFQNLEVLKKWFLKGTFFLYRSNHIFLNSVIIHKTKVLLPHAWVTIADFGYAVKVL